MTTLLGGTTTWDARDAQTGRHHRNAHLLVLAETDWVCEICRHTFDAASDANQFACGDPCNHGEELVHLPTSHVVHLKLVGHPTSPCGAGANYQGGWVTTSASDVTQSTQLRMCVICMRNKNAWRRRRGVR